MKIISVILKSASLWAMISVALRVGGGLITLPLALRVLTPAELGLYYTFLSLTGLALLLDFGFSQAVGRSSAFAMGGAREFQAVGMPDSNENGEPNWKLLAELIAAVKLWYRSAGLALGLLMIIPGTLFLMPLLKESNLSYKYLTCWWFFAGVTAFSFVSTYWPGLLFGIGSVKSAARIGFMSQLIGLVLLIAGLLCGLGLWSYGVSSIVSTLLTLYLTKKRFYKDAHQTLQIKVTKHDRNLVLSRIWPMAWRQGLVMLGAFMIQRGNTLICSAKLGLQETASYGLSSNLINLLLQVSIIPLSLTWPVISRLRVERDFHQIRRIFFLRLYGGLVFAAAIISIMTLWGNPLLNLIGAQTPILSTFIFITLASILWLECHHSQYGSLVLTENQNPFVVPALLSGLAIFCFSWWAAGNWGIMGMILAQGLVQFVWNNWWTVFRGIKGLYSKV